MKAFFLFLFLATPLLSASPRPSTDVTLETTNGTLHITYNLPDLLPKQGGPCILVLDGLKTGREALELVGDADPYVLIAYEYPKEVQEMWQFKALLHPLKTRQAILNVTTQLLDVIRWIESQPFCDKKPIRVMALSFGTVFVPELYHEAHDEGIQLGPAVLAYGGAGLKSLFTANLPVSPRIRKPLAILFAYLLEPVEPATHISYMTGEVLVIYGIHDKKVPLESARKLARLIPGSKTVVELDAGHLEPHLPEPLGQTLKISKQWFDEKRLKRELPNGKEGHHRIRSCQPR